MFPLVFPIAAASPAVQAVIGNNPVRFWPFGHAPQDEARPYAVYQQVYGAPENTLSCPADIDNDGVQVDSYAKTQQAARNVAAALRSAFEDAHCYIVAVNGEDWEKDTGLWRVSFVVEFWTPN